MSIIAVIGDCTTTTVVAMESSWPVHDDVVILEADRSGGSLAGWLDTPPTPSLSTIVANPHAFDAAPSSAWFVLDSMVQQTASGLRFIAAPVRAREASRSIDEAGTMLFPMLAGSSQPTVLADCGRYNPANPLPVLVMQASAIVVIHRQRAASAAAASVRLERLAEVVGDLTSIDVPIEVGVIGNRPFDLEEIHEFISNGDARVTSHGLADDGLSAAVFAGRTGVSAKRLRRLPLTRSVRGLVDAVSPSDGSRAGAGHIKPSHLKPSDTDSTDTASTDTDSTETDGSSQDTDVTNGNPTNGSDADTTGPSSSRPSSSPPSSSRPSGSPRSGSPPSSFTDHAAPDHSARST